MGPGFFLARVGTTQKPTVSLANMRPTLRPFLLLFLIGALSPAAISDVADSCKSDGPLLTGKDGKTVWLSPSELVKDAAHCVAPQMPTLAHQARIDGYVYVDILVDEKGHVACARLISGHPLLAGSAIYAASGWTFRPKKQKGQSVSFYGHLRFHFSTGTVGDNEDPCTVAH
jgi:TonB family protein